MSIRDAISALIGFGRRTTTPTPAPVAVQPDRIDVHRGVDVKANADIISGWKFCATMQLRTPIRVLSRHGEVHPGIDTEPPVIAHEMWEGIWIPEAKKVTYRSLGIDIDEPAFSMASDVGPIRADGGDYLPFLLAVRGAAEAPGTIKTRRDAVAVVLSVAAHKPFVRALGGKSAILERLFPSFLATIPRLSAGSAAAVAKLGYDTPARLAGATDEQLLGVSGVGPKLLSTIRTAAKAAPDQSSSFVDRVTR